MVFKLEIATDNAAFDQFPLAEVARILRATAEALETGRSSSSLHDLNGNQVGHYITEIDDADESYPPPCSDPGGHEWPRVEEHERCLCIHCGADGDA